MSALTQFKCWINLQNTRMDSEKGGKSLEVYRFYRKDVVKTWSEVQAKFVNKGFENSQGKGVKRQRTQGQNPH